MFEIAIENDQVSGFLNKLLQQSDDQTDLMADISRLLANVTEDAFQSEVSPFGTPWAPLKSGRPGKILQDTGQLAADIDADSGKDYAGLATSKIYAAIQQLGGQAGRGRSVTIPGRPYMPVDAAGLLAPDTESGILDLLNDYFNQSKNGV